MDLPMVLLAIVPFLVLPRLEDEDADGVDAAWDYLVQHLQV